MIQTRRIDSLMAENFAKTNHLSAEELDLIKQFMQDQERVQDLMRKVEGK